ncbi:hypothetical protein FA95DRAFT_1413952 [Auriscalpium vulgare]|uniref:Uncharacterized protein n=1 Tax=Auriscalpium vulgare TaxID=40419 RepID=A0ACB8RRI1_9AGAM|nr:hypothetical protein FA95DRAFT_1413952 [Auriscalpium vulgare]
MSDAESVLDAALRHLSLTIPVARLPPEILAAIFAILPSIDPPRRDAMIAGGKNTLGWPTITHVCQRWRSVALQDPTLWADIVVPFPYGDRWATAFFARAKSVPLTIRKPRSWSPLPPRASELALVSGHLAHTRILCLDITLAMLPALCRPAPLLQNLDLTASPPFPSDRSSCALPEDLLGGAAGAPSLQHLALRGAHPWTSPLLTHLVTLTVAQDNLAVHGVKLADALAALERIPALERIVLGLDDNDAVEVASPTVIALPKLRHLDLRAHYLGARLLFERLALPPDATIRCCLSVSSLAPVGEHTAFFKCIAERAGRIARIGIKSFMWEDGDAIIANLTVWGTARAQGAPSLVLQFMEDPYLGSEFGMMPSALSALASQHLETLAVWNDEEDFAWPHALGRASALRRVTVEGEAVNAFVSVLAQTPGLLPALACLVVTGGKFVAGLRTDLMARTLAERARDGHALEVLDLLGCDVDEESARDLRWAVPGMVLRWRSQ